jgi:2-methylisocitrate lyase-like PEP mutase family enzyme
MTPSSFKERLHEPRAILAPGVYDALSALVAEQAGFEALYLSGASIAYTRLGRSDVGLTTYTEVEDTLARITERVSTPVIVDADTGFGNALNVYHTVRTLERAGADCIQLEDQVAPKRCGHFSGKEVIAPEEAVSKIKAAVDARRDADLMIMARTDAAATHGFEAAVERAQRFAEAGADILFVEAVTTEEEIRALPRRLSGTPQLMNMVIGGKTPIFDADELGALGYGVVLYANAALQGAVSGMQKALTALRDDKQVQESSGLVAPFAERQRLVGKPLWDALEKRFT